GRRLPLRGRLKERGAVLARARRQFETGLASRQGKAIGAALSLVDESGTRHGGLRWQSLGEELTLWLGRLWEADNPYERLAEFWNASPLSGAGLWLPAAVLHLRDPNRFPLWDEASRRGYAGLDDSHGLGGSLAERYRLHGEGVA